MSGAFEKLFHDQTLTRKKADELHFWLRLAGRNKLIVKENERIAIYKWILKDPEIADKSGVIRKLILRHIQLNKINELVDVETLDDQPSMIRSIVRKRLKL